MFIDGFVLSEKSVFLQVIASPTIKFTKACNIFQVRGHGPGDELFWPPSSRQYEELVNVLGTSTCFMARAGIYVYLSTHHLYDVNQWISTCMMLNNLFVRYFSQILICYCRFTIIKASTQKGVSAFPVCWSMLVFYSSFASLGCLNPVAIFRVICN
jgi:hypothetical protein